MTCCPTCGHAISDISEEISLDLTTNTILTGKGSATLTPTAAAVAALLLKRRPEFVSNERIHEAVWSSRDIFVSDNTITSTVKKLRRVLFPLGLGVENRWGVGYRIRVLASMRPMNLTYSP